MSVEGGGTGYGSAQYAASLIHLGEALPLPASGAYLVRRPIGDGPHWDASAPYPLLSPARPERLADDLRALDCAAEGPVSVTAVIDPLAGATQEQLRAAFPHHLRPFKRHYLVELDRPLEEFVSSHHLRYLRRGLANVEVTEVPCSGDSLERWIELYARLVERHGITGAAAFSRESFEALAAAPGLVAFAARMEGRVVGMQLWLQEGERAWYHLAATDDEGYQARASHALMGSALRAMAERGARVALLGGSAGAGPAGEEDGLARFKSGWANRTETAYIGGRVCDAERYRALSSGRDDAGDWFPLYRRPRTTGA